MDFEHPLTMAEIHSVLRLLELGDAIDPWTEARLVKARNVLGQPITLIGAWPFTDKKTGRSYSHILAESAENSYSQFIVRVGGNASRQALYFAQEKMFPIARVLATIDVNGHDLYYWEDTR